MKSANVRSRSRYWEDLLVTEMVRKRDNHFMCIPATKDPNKDNLNVLFKLMEAFFYELTGKKVRLVLSHWKWDQWGKENPAIQDLFMKMVQDRDDWGLKYEYKHLTVKDHNIHVNFAGGVQIPDGRMVMFDLEFCVPEFYYQQKGFRLPLKQNEITSFFDMSFKNKSATEEMMEIWHRYCKDGFEKIKAYDMDNNQWIDEADDMFGNMTVFSLNRNKERNFLRIGDTAYGAVYLKVISKFFE